MKHGRLIEVTAFATLLACAPLQSTFAYIDPNSTGALYQLLFPLLVAFAAAFAAFRRVIARAFGRLKDVIASLWRVIS